ncbi:TD and POZ domain-containing protein 5 [Argiope bruennichi]|uniref:TD and POZ domain-containing protein 5 n=1 Tax=Argiope bruennichi TaxID=94029 RepID=A0A8T0EC95_ARGBR|nr:TD and POZ domain-containing protein 5 [Argiope bruennichi]
MANKAGNQRKCFTFFWKLKNARYCWQKDEQYIQSPIFVVDQIMKSKWALLLYPRYGKDNIGFQLHKLPDSKETPVEIYYEIALISLNGTISNSINREKRIFDDKSTRGSLWRVKRENALPVRSAFHQRDILTYCCRIWKTVGEFSENVQCIARTRVEVEKRLFTWNIAKFSVFQSGQSYVIKSLKSNKKRMSVRLFLTPDEKLHFRTTVYDKRIKYSGFHFCAVDIFKNTIADLRDEIWYDALNESKSFELKMLLTKKKLMEMKNIYLPNDVLSFKCKCVMTFETISDETEGITCDYIAFENYELDNCSSNDEDILSVSKNVLNESFELLLKEEPLYKSIMIDNLQSLISNGSLSDIKLKTRTRTYSAHMFILSARSPVFKAMFSSKVETNNGCVDIEDLDDDTVTGLLRYIYKSEVKELDWDTASKLYVGADKYQILALKDICSSYLKANLSVTNACGALLLADMHQNDELKGIVQSFILKNSKIIMSSEHWEKLMKTKVQLAAETMHLSFKN